MREEELRKQITETGKELLRDGLVARTWGNVSAKVDGEHFLITPSGLDYMQTTEADLALYHPADKTWIGPHKPSSEKGIHAAAYEIFPEVNFVIHTHQTYASAIGVDGFIGLYLKAEDKEKLGGLAIAEYGLPGTGKLKNAVTKAFESGAHTVLMKHHGVVIAGRTKEEAYERAIYLENLCKTNCAGLEGSPKTLDEKGTERKEFLLKEVRHYFERAEWVDTDATIRWSQKGREIVACLDDMAQMIGRKIKVERDDPEAIIKHLQKGENSLLIKGMGAIVCGMDKGDTEALRILVDKAAVCALHTESSKEQCALGKFDSALMRFVYQKKYSKQKNG